MSRPLTAKQAAFVAEYRQHEVRRLAALRELCRHIGLIAPCAALAIKQEELDARINRYGPQLLVSCVAVIISAESDPTNRAAAGLLLECFLPDWRSKLPPEVVGLVVERNDAEVRAWRKEVLDRDGHQCTRCGATENLEAHHIARWADTPELRIVPENGTTLCKPCHMEHHHG